MGLTCICNVLQVWLFRVWAIIWKGLLEIWALNISVKFGPIHKMLVVWSQCIGEGSYFFSIFLFQASEQNTYADIEAAYKCLEESYGTKQEDIILYGQSVGSGPTLDLAARLPQLRAVVLHSPILSGLRVMYPVKRTYWFDIYKVIHCLSISCLIGEVMTLMWLCPSFCHLCAEYW